ncbi:leucine-rich_repeat domain-containing protein [Hexamita inflata]|uniref:Leucine-rich repeat domain-containing protein n=1 Tax=Hexamita inflata TaxID=28002 RepID=A0AA86UJ85_9EUKA|nr:leucine-rich repeat domain-containing protein [Hexamita inflata]CAI9942088.1 leucine-rich repeat domain-containing protein [Hexamita inflata]
MKGHALYSYRLPPQPRNNNIMPQHTYNTLQKYVQDMNQVKHNGKTLQINNNCAFMSFDFVDELDSVQNLILVNCSAITFTKVPTKIQQLSIQNCDIGHIGGIQQMTQLTLLQLTGNDIKDIGVLSNLVNLEELDLSNNKIECITAFSSLKQLRILNLTNNLVYDIQSLSGLQKLRMLFISQNRVINVFMLRFLVDLKELNLSHNRIINVNSLKYLQNLTFLDCAFNQIKNFNPLYQKQSIIRQEPIEETSEEIYEEVEEEFDNVENENKYLKRYFFVATHSQNQTTPTKDELLFSNKLQLIHNLNFMQTDLKNKQVYIKNQCKLFVKNQQRKQYVCVRKQLRMSERIVMLVQMSDQNADQ